MRWIWIALACLGVAGCGIDGTPVPPGSGVDPNVYEDGVVYPGEDFFS